MYSHPLDFMTLFDGSGFGIPTGYRPGEDMLFNYYEITQTDDEPREATIPVIERSRARARGESQSQGSGGIGLGRVGQQLQHLLPVNQPHCYSCDIAINSI